MSFAAVSLALKTRAVTAISFVRNDDGALEREVRTILKSVKQAR